MHVLSSPVPSALPVALCIHARGPCRAADVLCRSATIVLVTGAVPAGQKSVYGLVSSISPCMPRAIPCDETGGAPCSSPDTAPSLGIDHPLFPMGVVRVRALSARTSAARTRSHCAEIARVASVSTGVGAGRRQKTATWVTASLLLGAALMSTSGSMTQSTWSRPPCATRCRNSRSTTERSLSLVHCANERSTHARSAGGNMPCALGPTALAARLIVCAASAAAGGAVRATATAGTTAGTARREAEATEEGERRRRR
eukprot:scaffold28684_cov44-Phaeocystis_antarctica.AAC.3